MSKDLLGEVEDAVKEQMQQSVLLCSWADYADEHHLTKPGGTYEGTMPEAIREPFRSEAYHLGERMYAAIREKWQAETGNVFVEPWACLVGWVIRNDELGRFDQFLKKWAHYAVMSAIGSGVSWEDDNTPLQALNMSSELVEVEIRGLNFEIPEWDA
jgi:hypothetical protein